MTGTKRQIVVAITSPLISGTPSLVLSFKSFDWGVACRFAPSLSLSKVVS